MAHIGLARNHIRKFILLMMSLLVFAVFLLVTSTRVNGETTPSPWLGGSQPNFGGLDNTVGSIPEKYGSTGNTNCIKQTITTKSAFKIFGATISPAIEHQDCATETLFGSVSQQLLSRDGTSLYGKIYGLPGGIQIMPVVIANSDKLIFSDNSGGRWRLIENTSVSITSQPFDHQVKHFISGIDESRILKDHTGSDLEVRLPIFSPNGRWMVAESRMYGMYRMDLNNYEVIFFEKPFDYNISLDPQQQLAVSNDGRYIALASGRQPKFKLFDMSTCNQPTAPNTVANCDYRNLLSFMQEQVPDPLSVRSIRFSDQYTLTLFVSYRDSSGNYKRAYTYITAPGYTPVYFNYLSLGDSFASGEGAYEYRNGTDVKDPFNKCHLSNISYPFLVAQLLELNTYQSVACSGAKIKDMSFGFQNLSETSIYNTKERQSKGKENADDNDIFDNFLVGYRTQIRYVEKYKPSVVTLSMAGNDIGFDKIVARCVGYDTCYSSSDEKWELAQKINELFDPLVKLYTQIQEQAAPNAKIYVVGYPSFVKEGGNCALNVHANADELVFFNKLVRYLNFVIKEAALKSGVSFIDVEDAFNGSRLCEGATGSVAVNGLTAGNDKFLDIGPIGKESFHPNRIGHGLFRDKILERTSRFALKNPEPNSSIPTPGFVSAADFVGITLPSFTNRSIDDDGLIDGLVYHNGTYRLQSDEFAPNSQVDGQIHSDPINFGSFMTNAEGSIDTEVIIPSSLATGYHEVHLFGKNISGEDIDVQKLIYVAANEKDYDGDGIMNEDEPCTVVEPSGQDSDKDGVDDGCDGFIGEPPIDTTAPAVIGQPDREPNIEGWYKGDVTINWSVSDAEPSSGTPNTPLPTTASLDGENTYTSDQSCDPNNNCASGSYSLKIDKTAPEINFTVDPNPSPDGWNNSSVSITFHCSDLASGIISCSEPVTLTEANGSYIITGQAKDRAGNMSDINAVVQIDTGQPSLSSSISPAANETGWHNTDVHIKNECDDSLSGIDYCSPDVLLRDEGFGQSSISSAHDRAGNSISRTSLINIDRTAPILGAPLWSNNPKPATSTTTFAVPISDNLSGVVEGEYFLGDNDPGQGSGATMTLEGANIATTFGTDFPTGVYKVSARAKDAAGNWSVPVSDYIVVYNPTGLRMTGKKTIVPSLDKGDILPGLVQQSQTEKARFGFNIRYDDSGQIHKTSDFQFAYETGTSCKKPAEARNCHSLTLNATSFAWLTTMGANKSTGIFQGIGELKIDGLTNQVIFRVAAVDGELLGANSADNLTLQIFNIDDNPNTDSAIYQVSGDVERGSVRIRQ